MPRVKSTPRQCELIDSVFVIPHSKFEATREIFPQSINPLLTNSTNDAEKNVVLNSFGIVTQVTTTTTSSNTTTSHNYSTSQEAVKLISKIKKPTLFPKSDKDSEFIKLQPHLCPIPPIGHYYLPEKLSLPVSRDREKEIISCSVCEKLMRRGSLREHMDRHDNSGKFECSLCGKNFSRASAREKHIRTHTGERPFSCPLCSKSYRQKVHLNEHMRSHTGERPYVCRLCGFSLTSKSLLNRHLRTHGVSVSANEAPEMWLRTDAPTSRVLAAAAEVGRSLVQDDDQPEDCTLSPDNIPERPETLRVTALNGTATIAVLGRNHLCSLCPAGFPTIQALRSHRSTTHGIVTPNNCSLCQASFTSMKMLKIHLRKVHPQICPICDEHMVQRRRWILEVHIREMHPGVSAESVLGPSPLAVGRSKKEKNSKPKRISKNGKKKIQLEEGVSAARVHRKRTNRSDSNAFEITPAPDDFSTPDSDGSIIQALNSPENS